MGFGGDDDGDDDSDLEAELAAITGGGGKIKPKPKPKAALVAPSELEKMIAESLKDVVTDDEGDDVENDEELLGELQGISGGHDEVVEDENVIAEVPQEEQTNINEEPQLFLPTTALSTADIIKQRLEMYKLAEANAKAAGESTKARRFGRGLKTLNDLLKQVSAGKQVNVDDIPPEVFVKPAGGESAPTAGDVGTTIGEGDGPAVPVRKAPSPPSTPQNVPNTVKSDETTVQEKQEESSVIQDMRVRQKEYKAAALEYKRSGDTATALQFLKVVKQFDVVIKMCADGQEVDLSDMPPPPDQFKQFLENMQASAEQPKPQESPATDPPPVEQSAVTEATSMQEALQQRLDKYKSVEEAAKAEGNASKARRFGRIVKQYEDALKAYKAGRTVAFDELPVPPGFGPLPVENTAPSVPSPQQPPVTPKPLPPPETPGSGSQTPATSPTSAPKKSPPQINDLTTRTSGNHQRNNLAEQQMKILLERQREFKVAALEAKKAGEIDQAKEYLKIYKGFDSLLNAASSGLPVDLNTVSVKLHTYTFVYSRYIDY